MSYYRGLAQIDTTPLIDPKQEDLIIQSIIGPPPAPQSFLQRNKLPVFIGGTVLFFGTLGLILMLEA